MTDTPRVPLQGNIRLSSIAPGRTNFPTVSTTIIADGNDPIVVTDDEAIFESPFIEYKCVQFTRDTSLVSGPQIITGIGFKPSLILFQTGTLAGNLWGSLGQAQASDTPGQLFAIEVGFSFNSVFSQPGLGGIQRTDSAGVNYAYFYVLSFDVDGFTLQWTKVASPTVTALINAACFK